MRRRDKKSFVDELVLTSARQITRSDGDVVKVGENISLGQNDRHTVTRLQRTVSIKTTICDNRKMTRSNCGAIKAAEKEVYPGGVSSAYRYAASDGTD